MPAMGTTLPLSSYQALFALIGTTYGGNGTSNFQLPDLRGRVVVGVGQGAGLPNYVAGNTGGTPSTVLTTSQMPSHVHLLATGGGGVTVTAGVGSLTAATSLNGVTASAAASGLSLKGFSGGAGSASASGGALATPASPANKIYAAATPDVTMAAGSITGTAPVTFAGSAPSTTLSGAPSVSVGGQTAPAGSGMPINTMPPYLAMNYYIAYTGLFPTSD